MVEQRTRPETYGPAIPSTAAINGHPIHPILVLFPVAFLVGTLLSDIAYAASNDPFWARASLWLVGAGVIAALLAAVFGLTDYLGDRRIRQHQAANIHLALNVGVVILAAISWWMRADNPEEAVVPWGLTLSAIWSLALVVSGWFGGELAYRHGVGHVPFEEGAGQGPRAVRYDETNPERGDTEYGGI